MNNHLQQQQVFTAELTDRVISFSAPNPQEALKRAKFYEKNITIKRLYCNENGTRRAIWDPHNDFGVVPKPPKNWKWFYRLLLSSWVLSPLTPIMMFLSWVGLSKVPTRFNELQERFSP